jgi:hypothetical protein
MGAKCLQALRPADLPRLEKETPNYPPQRQTLESHVRRQFPETETKSL